VSPILAGGARDVCPYLCNATRPSRRTSSFSSGSRFIYTFDEVVLFLKVTNSEDVLGHHIFRQFSIMRKEEMKRLARIGGSVETLKFPGPCCKADHCWSPLTRYNLSLWFSWELGRTVGESPQEHLMPETLKQHRPLSCHAVSLKFPLSLSSRGFLLLAQGNPARPTR